MGKSKKEDSTTEKKDEISRTCDWRVSRNSVLSPRQNIGNGDKRNRSQSEERKKRAEKKNLEKNIEKLEGLKLRVEDQ